MTAQVKPFTGTKVIIWVAVFFAVVFSVNGTFVYFAMTSWTGLTTKTAYTDGVNFNRNFVRIKAQRKRGWQSKISNFSSKNITVQFTDKQGKALSSLDVGVKLMRPLRDRFDRTVRLKETSLGTYSSAIALPLSGRWQVEVRAKNKNNEPYLLIYDLMVK